MKFVDEAVVLAVAGDGGSGCCSFFRARFRPVGAADGGDGGAGGSVSLQVSQALHSLVDVQQQHTLRAKNGGRGGKRCCHGARGADLIVPVPPGTAVFHAESGEILGDLTAPGQTMMVAKGGSGGLGNANFKSSTNRSPQRTVPPGSGEQLQLRMELRLIADVGLLGLPNAGKSLLLRAISRARPKVGAYPFTTLTPHIGVVHTAPDMLPGQFTVADIPGLIQGAAAGSGLGNRFLRHLRRTRVLLHIIDCSGSEDIASQMLQINTELDKAGGFADTEMLYAGNKIDLLSSEELSRTRARIAEASCGRPCFMISALTGAGCQELCDYLASSLEQQPCQMSDKIEA